MAEARAQLTHHELLFREALASALYVAIVLVGAVIAIPAETLPQDLDMVFLILGTAAGLVLAHWFAFRLASQLAGSGSHPQGAVEEAAAQLVGGLAVAALAAAPYLIFDGRTARSVSLAILIALPGVTGALVVHRRGGSHLRAVGWAVVMCGAAIAVVVVKSLLTH